MTNISKSLVEWYSRYKRDLPWRETKNPYHIWVSEIILQQTRVNQGFNYYYRFIDKFPDIKSLAFSNIDDLLKIWQGLGYYSRARNMHFTAQDIINNYDGEFPSDYSELIKLKGIGDYTASAIASISFNQATPVLDGNVFRVIARIYGISESTQRNAGKKHFKKILQEIIPDENPGTFNQAIMEFGALQCTPKNPDCENCILKSVCFAYTNNMVAELPLKKQKITQRIRYFNYIYIIYKDFTFIEKRTNNDIWKLLYQLPLIETENKVSIENLEKTQEWNQLFEGLEPEIDINFYKKKHILSHQILVTHVYKVRINTMNDFLLNNYLKIYMSTLPKYGIPKLLENYLKVANK
ncbi:MAG TPA: A/G-specific adenine glycosylase [Bacteroidales bacterium]|jgi:A/G-specific adenine glycosylase|nr:A/G-specific adenine glycosylase [Bacteroidales bacterium]